VEEADTEVAEQPAVNPVAEKKEEKSSDGLTGDIGLAPSI
jgi:hypothetical protein